MLVSKKKSYFYNEAVPINEKFRLKKCLSDEKKQEAFIKELQRMRAL